MKKKDTYWGIMGASLQALQGRLNGLPTPTSAPGASAAEGGEQALTDPGPASDQGS